MCLALCVVLCCVLGHMQITEGVRAAVRACVEKSTNSEGRIVEVNPVADFFSKALGKSHPVASLGTRT